MWMAGMTMCDGVWWASWMIHSPRSVSSTSMPACSKGLVQVDLLGGHGLGLDHPLHALLLGEGEDVLLHLGGVGGPEDLGRRGLPRFALNCSARASKLEEALPLISTI